MLLAGCENAADGAASAYLQKYVGRNVAALTVQDLDGKTVALKDILAQGRPVLLNVWATWCAPCTEELPSLAALGQGGKYAVVAISTDKDAADIRAYLKRENLGPGMTVLWDSLGMVTTPAVGSRALPASYLLDVSGTVKLVAAGAREWNHPKMLAKMDAALK